MITSLFLGFFFYAHILSQEHASKSHDEAYSNNHTSIKKKSEKDATKWLIQSNNEILKLEQENTLALWEFSVNRTDDNEEKKENAAQKVQEFQIKMFENLSNYNWKSFSDKNIKSQMEKISRWKIFEPSYEKYKYNDLIQEMSNIFEDLTRCGYYDENEDCTLNIRQDLLSKMGVSQNYSELLDVWRDWHDKLGKAIKPKFTEMIEVANADARNRGFTDVSEEWEKEFGIKQFELEMYNLYMQVFPLYEEIHTYVRKRLKQKYGDDKFPSNGGIPAHILGDMWGMKWTNIVNYTIPFEHKPLLDVTKLMKIKILSVKQMYQKAEYFYHSLGLPKFSKDFWAESIFEKPLDKELICSSSFFDFYDNEHFRIKSCSNISLNDWNTAYSLTGYLSYALSYKDQPYLFRRPAYSTLHYAISDAILLSAFSPKHLKALKLLKREIRHEDYYINSLYHLALQKIPFLAYAFVSDFWRWNIFNDEIKMEELNEKWWKFRFYYSGISPPEERSEEYFDPAGKWNIPANIPFTPYFISTIIQFQIHKNLCKISGHGGPLHRCDIFRSKKAGNILREAMKLGDSKPWADILKKLTGSTEIDASALMEYFQPLKKWLENENKDEDIGWEFD